MWQIHFVRARVVLKQHSATRIVLLHVARLMFRTVREHFDFRFLVWLLANTQLVGIIGGVAAVAVVVSFFCYVFIW